MVWRDRRESSCTLCNRHHKNRRRAANREHRRGVPFRCAGATNVSVHFGDAAVVTPDRPTIATGQWPRRNDTVRARHAERVIGGRDVSADRIAGDAQISWLCVCLARLRPRVGNSWRWRTWGPRRGTPRPWWTGQAAPAGKVKARAGKADALARCRNSAFCLLRMMRTGRKSQRVSLGNYIHIPLLTPAISARASSARRAPFINDSNTTLY